MNTIQGMKTIRRTDEDGNVFEDQLLNTKDLVSTFGTPKGTWELRRQKGTGPRFIQLSSRSVKYWLSDVLAWVEASTVTNTKQVKYHDRR
jgi:predicted DNA-binding transcriptional regulator AlpA